VHTLYIYTATEDELGDSRMSETQSSVTKPKKMVSRNVAIALGIIFIVVIAGLAVAFAYYINDKNNTITSLNIRISSKDSQISQLNSNVTNLQNQLNDLNSTVNDLNKVVNFEKTQYWEGGEQIYYNASSYHEWGSNADYAGYLEVDVQSNATSTYVQVAYYSYGVHYDNQIVVGAGNTRTYFPILPALTVTTKVGNTNLFDGALIGVTIIYHY